MHYTPVLAEAFAAVAAMGLTEADESARHGTLIAYANHRFQLYMGESMGVIDMYEEAAVARGVPRTALEMDRNRLRRMLAPLSADQCRNLALSLNLDVRAYLDGDISRDELCDRQHLYFYTPDLTTA